jgi:hypothetical protein
MSKKYFLLLYVLTYCLGFSLCIWSHSYAASATDTNEEQKLIEEENRRELKETTIAKPPPKKEAITFRTGGWFTTLFRDYTDSDNDADTTELASWILTEDLRLWSQLTYQQDYTLYVRLKHLYTRRDISSRSTSYASDYEGPSLDMAYLAINKANWRMPIELTLGKQYLFIGRGIAYSDVNYGLKLKTNFGSKLFLKSFASMTGENDPNIDESVPNYKKTGSRVFAGLELAYSGLPNNILYGYALIQRDKNPRFPPETTTQSYRYNSEYYGLGLQSNIPKSRVNYWLEAINERGTSNTDADAVEPEEKNINAWSFDCGAHYNSRLPLKPTLELEYAFGSGDKDRSSVTDTHSGGNRYGSDTNFLYFGSFFAGYALAPRLSNLHIYKADLSLKPFEMFKAGKRITCGAKYFIYRKDKKAAGIYDTEATLNSLDIGQEANAYLYWQIGKHVYWSSRYGIFYPGNAYPSTTNNHTEYFYTRLNITF